ncbi:MAG: hypothetical protein NC203_09715 [Firmicutes bacterium]|nr:hypothetical protein [[Eubacterium] siraeum]MCM1488632.1 hypothetical protein [Bacillota bacterium]
MARGNHEKKNPPKWGTMDIILVFTAITLIAFTVVMVWLFAAYGGIPDTLCTCVFAVLGGECGVMGWIKTNKDKIRERKWEKEDRKDKEND